MGQTFIIIYKQGPAWIKDKPYWEQPLMEHGDYMHQLYSAGILRFAGPFSDNMGGATIIETASIEEAQDILRKDPAIISKVFIGELHPWYLVDWEHYGKSQKTGS